MQAMIWDLENNANMERYGIHPSKSSSLIYCPGRRVECTDFYLAGQKVTPESNTVHLGIKRDVSGKLNVDEKVTLGRRTAYSLMGAGFHSVNGLKTSQNSHIWKTLVVPRIVFGLEVLLLNKKDFEYLESSSPPVIFIPGRPKVAFCFGSLVILDVARCYLWLFTLYINIKIGKNSC